MVFDGNIFAKYMSASYVQSTFVLDCILAGIFNTAIMISAIIYDVHYAFIRQRLCVFEMMAIEIDSDFCASWIGREQGRSLEVLDDFDSIATVCSVVSFFEGVILDAIYFKIFFAFDKPTIFGVGISFNFLFGAIWNGFDGIVIVGVCAAF